MRSNCLHMASHGTNIFYKLVDELARVNNLYIEESILLLITSVETRSVKL